jgi:hypothetical protein
MTVKQPDNLPSPFKRVLPESLKVGKDHLMLRLDFYSEAIVMQEFGKKNGTFKMVSAYDVAHAMANELSFGSGILPENTLWWSNDKNGPVVALWIEAGVRRLALQTEAMGPPERYDVPLPGLIFLCRPGQPPYVYAASKRPAAPKDRVYKAPLANIYNDGRTCPGNHQYPSNVADIPDSFFHSFFSPGANLDGRSKKYPQNITSLWKELDIKTYKHKNIKAEKHKDRKTEYPLEDLVYHGTVADLMGQRL